VVRRIEFTSGRIDTVVGTGERGVAREGSTPSAAPLARPFGVSVSPEGALYISDTFNHRILRIPTGSLP
jgi:glucose/arabinose dehydrogenase